MKKYLLLLLLIPSIASAWTMTADFEEGNVGDMAATPLLDAFSGTAKRSFIADSHVYSGSQSGSVTAEQGSTGFGYWGGSWKYGDRKLHEGDSLWWKVVVFYPAGWDFSCGGCTEGMKFMRIHVAKSNGDNIGYLHTFIKGGTSDGRIVASSEVGGSAFGENNFDSGNWPRFELGEIVTRDTWITFEHQVKFSTGRGEYRLWQDGELIFEDLETRTMHNSSDVSDFVYFYTYWNNGAPKTQTAYVDEVVLTTDTPSNRDSHGNPYIGVGEYDGTEPPTQPPVDPVEPPSDGVPETITDFTVNEDTSDNVLAEAYLAVSNFLTSGSKDYVFDFAEVTTDTDGEPINIKRYYLFDGDGNWIENIDYSQVPFVRTLPMGEHGFMLESESVDGIASDKTDVVTVDVTDEPTEPPTEPPVITPPKPILIEVPKEGMTVIFVPEQ